MGLPSRRSHSSPQDQQHQQSQHHSWHIFNTCGLHKDRTESKVYSRPELYRSIAAIIRQCFDVEILHECGLIFLSPQIEMWDAVSRCIVTLCVPLSCIGNFFLSLSDLVWNLRRLCSESEICHSHWFWIQGTYIMSLDCGTSHPKNIQAVSVL